MTDNVKGVDILVPLKGNPTIQAIGYSGRQCIKATEEIEQALGSVDDRRMTQDAYKEHGTERLRQGG